MPNILDLFDADYRPNREFERTIQPDDPVTLYRDLRDYVLPPEVGEWLSGLPDGFVHQYLASTNNLVDALRTWITGFFGSGKSHLLKVLAHLLCNSPVQDDNGVTIGAAQYLCTRLGFPNIATLIIAQLIGRPLIIQMLGYARSDKAGTPESTISYIILRHLERLLGYSEVPWIAQYERLLKQHNHWPDFCQFVVDTSTSEGVPQEWNAIRNDVYIAHPYLVQGLHKFLPRTFKSEQLAADAMSLAERKKPEPDFVVKRLLAEATAIDPHKGRMVVCLDEVRLYLGKEPDRVTELQAIAEATKTIGQGKVFLIVTGQESPEDVDSRFYQPEAGIGILTDRFPERFRLSENNIDYVVCQRLLRKSSSGPHINSLRALIAASRPQLATAACIRNTMQNPGGRFTNTEPADLERYYPLLPYHVILLQEILTRLRTTGPSGGVVGTKERAILIIIRALFGEPTSLLLGAEPIGALVTFDRVYDVLEEELKGIHLNQRDQIVQIEQCGEPDADFLASVAKAVLLVQQAAKRYFRVTDEVVAAVLYPRLGADPNAHLNKVKDALKRLSETGLRYITEDTDLGYRFLTETETRFEKVAAEQDVTEADRFAVLKESATIALKKKYFRHEYSGKHGKRKFDVGVTLTDGPGKASASLSAGSHLELQVLTPTAADADPQWADAALIDSTGDRARIVWSIKDLGKLAETVERIVRVRKALTDSRLSTTDAKEQEQIEAQRQRAERLAHDDGHSGCLPAQIVQGMSQGTLVWNGDKRELIGIPVADDVFADTANKAIKSVFTEFDSGSAVVVDGDLTNVLTWTTARPKCVEKLELMDNTGKALLDRPVLKTVMDRLCQPDHTADEMRTGESLAAEFDGAPFGWDEHVVRSALATLLRAGALIVKEGAVEIRTSTDPKAKEVFSGWNRFKKAVFEYAGELTPEQRQAATRALQTLFGRAGEDTFEKIDRALNEELNTRLPQVAELASAAQAIQLPCVGVLGQLRQDLLAIQQAHAGTQRILVFLDAQRQTRLASNVPASRGLQQFRSSGSLDQYQRIRSFVSYPATPFAQRVGSDVAAQLGSLRSDLGHVEFYSGARWAAITQAHTVIRQAYMADYRQSHARREQLLRDLITNCQQHRNWNRLDTDAQQAILNGLGQRSCAADPGLLDESAGFVCPTCQSDAGALSSQITSVPALEAQQLARLGAFDQPPTPEPRPGLETLVFAKEKAVAPEEVGAFAESLGRALSAAVTKGAVTVDVQIHTQTREGE